MSKSLPHSIITRRRFAPAARIALVAIATSIALAHGAAWADQPALPASQPAARPHAVGDVFNYSLTGSMSQKITAHDAFGRLVAQSAIPTDVRGRERIAIKGLSSRGLSLHRSGSIVATFKGKSSPAQSGTGWTLVTPAGDVEDRKGSTLGGLFLLPLGYLGDQAVNGGAAIENGDRFNSKLGMALFGMTARPRLNYIVTGTRQVFGLTVFTLAATGTAPVREPIVTNDGVALGDAVGTAKITLHCDYDLLLRRVVSMDIIVSEDLRIASLHHRGGGTITDRQHYLVALDASSMEATQQPVDPPPAPTAKATSSPY